MGIVKSLIVIKQDLVFTDTSTSWLQSFVSDVKFHICILLFQNKWQIYINIYINKNHLEIYLIIKNCDDKYFLLRLKFTLYS